MAELTIEQKLEFFYDASPQRSPQWLKRKQGKIGASRLEDWMAVSKAKATMGKPLKARLDYEKELMFERQFDTHFEVWVNEAMQQGIDYEDFAAQQFADEMDVELAEVGCWYNHFMAISPDRLVFPRGTGVTFLQDESLLSKATGIVEIKIVKDNTFTQILMADPKETHAIEFEEGGEKKVVGTGIPEKHWKQIQAQLKATKLERGWYVALNFNTKKYVIIEVVADPEFQEYMMEAIQEELVTKPFALDKVHNIKGDIPAAVELGAPIDRSDSNLNGGW